ncbi:hypothetical protein N7G274_008256 [Stereocaulon virgatum]|uniref:Uncharacterized protein n=1 Tax=Stereocaulon virgatum TaxID=373712 RepID=A0ABR4A1U0_9LECA
MPIYYPGLCSPHRLSPNLVPPQQVCIGIHSKILSICVYFYTPLLKHIHLEIHSRQNPYSQTPNCLVSTTLKPCYRTKRMLPGVELGTRSALIFPPTPKSLLLQAPFGENWLQGLVFWRISFS